MYFYTPIGPNQSINSNVSSDVDHMNGLGYVIVCKCVELTSAKCIIVCPKFCSSPAKKIVLV